MKARQYPLDGTIVSCDIVGHGFEPDHSRQIDRIEGLNAEIRRSLRRYTPETVVWASGGDGGHVAFLIDEALPEAIELVRRLRNWAARESVLLRITCHRGLLSSIEGADGRVQLVGEGINLCGSLVNFGAPGRIVVTSQFRDYVNSRREAQASLPAMRFEDERVVYLKHFAARTLCLLAFADDPEDTWEVERSDHRQLQEALRVGNPWQIIYHMKRLLQVDSADPNARNALNDIQPRSLTHGRERTAHPLLGVLSRLAFARLLRAAELVERDDGDIICQRNDTGDSMFIVLKGQIGVVTRPPSDIRIAEGGIVGELALALNRPRTATLQAVGPTALLALNYDSLTELLQHEGPESRLATSFKHFLDERIVEHLCRHSPYLQLDYSDEEKASDAEPWDRMVDGATRIVIEPTQAQRVSFGVTPGLDENGLYILASGNLVEISESRSVPKELSGMRFDILFAHIPGAIVSVNHEFRLDTRKPENRVTIIRISDTALVEYAGDQFPKIVDCIRKRLASQMVFDAFVSYADENADLATRWKEAMVKAKLSVYMNTPSAMTRFEPEIDLALAESRVLVPVISRASLKSDWVQREIEKRKMIFEELHANILPIETEHRLAERMAVGFTPILAGKRDSEEERAAMQSAIETIRDVALGKREPPFSTMARKQ